MEVDLAGAGSCDIDSIIDAIDKLLHFSICSAESISFSDEARWNIPSTGSHSTNDEIGWQLSNDTVYNLTSKRAANTSTRPRTALPRARDTVT